ncbi:MAG: double-strand break repair protein AddB [Rhodobacter sp.]|nr:double-strand break repair protein AddB [Rhodobacter sp.]
MFETESPASVFAVPPGVDFPKAVIDGLLQRFASQPPEDLARVQVYVNTRRMHRRMQGLFDQGPARLLPRLRLITDLAADTALADIPRAVSPLQRRLELSQLVARLLEQEPDLAAPAALYDLADSLANLMDEMAGEGVSSADIRGLDVSDQSGHWQRSLRFVTLVDDFLNGSLGLDADARQRAVVERLADRWRHDPPQHPILVAGSTGSRGTTALFMQAVAKLPHGALILPGFDFDMPVEIWGQMGEAAAAEDHPQFRYRRLMQTLDLQPGDIRRWVDTPPPNPDRNRLMSLALRPAPVTDGWMTDGPRLRGITSAAASMTLVEAPSVRAEASAIAMALRKAAEDGRVAALITPDRVLTRQVSAALDRWGIVPDDSAGRPLPLTAPGRFLRHVADLFGERLTSEKLLTLLKHPLTNTGSEDRGAHLLYTRELELNLRRYGPPFPRRHDLIAWAFGRDAGQDTGCQTWATWLSDLIDGLDRVGSRSLAQHLDRHIRTAEGLSAGPRGTGTGALWDAAAGEEAVRRIAELRQAAGYGGSLSARDYSSLFNSVLQRGEVREATVAHPHVMIWGTLEARVQGADLVILGGLNEGVWPEPPAPDPWLNRTLRQRAGLLLPERRIGLAAHDFQQAIAAEEVILTRSVRDAEAQTVPSRWINRLTNLLDGISGEGSAALQSMRNRGQKWLSLADRLDHPPKDLCAAMPPATRPSPQPPVDARPKELSITEIQTLIRDPYAVYARRILGLRPLDPLQRLPDAPMRGTVLHKVLERFVSEAPVSDAEEARTRLLDIADAVLTTEAPWPAAQRMWRAKLMRIADWFIAGEIDRQSQRSPIALEARGHLDLADLDLRLVGKIDRIDRAFGSALAIYDYKTGAPPTQDQQLHFDKQLALAAVMAELGTIEGLEPAHVCEVAYIGLGENPRLEARMLDRGDIPQTLAELRRLIAAYRQRTRGYTSKRAVMHQIYGGDYDHLARYGEWDTNHDPDPVEVGA